MYFKINKNILIIAGSDAAMLTALMRGPVPCPNVKRNSAAVHNLRRIGVDIYTERVKTGGGKWYGLYHLKSRVTQASQRDIAAYSKAKAAPAVKAVR